MKKTLKKISLLGMLLMLIVLCAPNVKAAKQCTKYTDYYLFEKREREGDNVRNGFEHTNSSPAASLPEGAVVDTASSGRVRITYNGKNDGTNKTDYDPVVEEWTLENFYVYYRNANYNKIKDTDGFCKAAIENKENTNLIGKDCGEPLLDNTNSALINATFFPTDIGIKYSADENEFAVYRKAVPGNFTGLTPISYYWEADSNNPAGNSDTYFSPAAYKLVYDVCTEEEEPAKYNVTINYYYYKDNNPTTDKISPSYTDKVKDGEEVKVPSPEIPGCSIVRDNGKTYDVDKVVSIKVSGKNVEKNVYYYCPTENAPSNNVKTGDSLIYIAWAIGFGSLAYAVYYFAKDGKLKKEEV